MKTVGTPGAIKTPSAYAGNLGQGIKYPLTIDGNGRLLLSSGLTSVSDSIASILLTTKGERVMQNDYGAGATGLFDPADPVILAAAIQQSILEHEPRVSSVSVSVQSISPSGKAVYNIAYTVRGEATQQTLTFPIFNGPA